MEEGVDWFEVVRNADEIEKSTKKYLFVRTVIAPLFLLVSFAAKVGFPAWYAPLFAPHPWVIFPLGLFIGVSLLAEMALITILGYWLWYSLVIGDLAARAPHILAKFPLESY